MQRLENMYDVSMAAGLDRIDGVVTVMISWWISQGGLADIEQTADRCAFEAMKVKKDDVIGEIILAQRDYVREMLDRVGQDPSMSHVLKTIGVGPTDIIPTDIRASSPAGPHRIIRYRMEGFVGHAVMDSGWWKRNEKRIKKERDKFAAVSHVMGS